jgi:hypothetical protein
MAQGLASNHSCNIKDYLPVLNTFFEAEFYPDSGSGETEGPRDSPDASSLLILSSVLSA